MIRRLVLSDAMFTGIPYIDEQYKKLVDDLNRLLLAQQKGSEPEALTAIVNDFLRRLRGLFTVERGIFEQYAQKSAQRQDDLRMESLIEIASFQARCRGGEKVSQNAIKSLHAWLIKNVLEGDNPAAVLLKMNRCLPTPRYTG